MEIAVHGLSFKYKHSEEWAVRDVNTHIAQGELALVVGPGGSGKSTFLYCLNGLIPGFIKGDFQGTVTVGDMDTQATPISTITRDVALVFQNPETQFFTTSVEEELALGLENVALPPSEIEQRVAWGLDLIGLTRYRFAPIYALSGGQKQLLALASVVVAKPQVILLDEPTANLDPSSSEKMYRVLRQVRDTLGTTIVMIDHKIEAILESIGTDFRVLAFKEGRLILDSTARCVFSDPNLTTDIGLRPPAVSEIAAALEQSGHSIGLPTTVDEGITAICRLLNGSTSL
ncbi:MAG TPA: ABC transporter ATP-binding protein [Firmicutes bacterium]|nr:ABC transporter ATP-binding protein [Bacillota bacterium]